MSQPANIFPLAYTGVRAQRPPNIIVKNFPPQPTFSQNFDLGDFWINFNPQNPTAAQIWVLLGLTGGVANWVLLEASSGNMLTLTGNSGGIVPPLAGNINVVGDTTTINVTGNPATHTLTINAITNGTTIVSTLTGNGGGAVSPTGGNINVVGDGTTITVTGNPGTSTLTISAIGSGVLETITGDSGGAIAPTAGTIIFTGGTTGLTFAGTNAPGKQTLTGVLNPANGGTGSNDSTFTTDGVFYWDGTKLATTSAGAGGQVLTSNGPGVAPTYQAAGAMGAASFFGASQATHLIGGIRYYQPFAFGAFASEATAEMIIPLNCNVNNLYCNVTSNANTVNGTVTVFKNGIATALVVTITALTTGVFSNLVNTIAFAAGDAISFELSQATTGSCIENISCKLTPT